MHFVEDPGITLLIVEKFHGPVKVPQLFVRISFKKINFSMFLGGEDATFNSLINVWHGVCSLCSKYTGF